jgi:hypothetical protein
LRALTDAKTSLRSDLENTIGTGIVGIKRLSLYRCSRRWCCRTHCGARKPLSQRFTLQQFEELCAGIKMLPVKSAMCRNVDHQDTLGCTLNNPERVHVTGADRDQPYQGVLADGLFEPLDGIVDLPRQGRQHHSMDRSLIMRIACRSRIADGFRTLTYLMVPMVCPLEYFRESLRPARILKAYFPYFEIVAERGLAGPS